jgi:hypothetical protein
MTTVRSPMCLRCLRYRGARTCDPFPGGIPERVFFRAGDHRTPIAGDGGLVFVQDPDRPRIPRDGWNR